MSGEDDFGGVEVDEEDDFGGVDVHGDDDSFGGVEATGGEDVPMTASLEQSEGAIEFFCSSLSILSISFVQL